MEESFTITIEHKGKELHLQALMIMTSYWHKCKVTIAETEVLFEPDEEGNYRAVLPPGADEKTKQEMDVALLQNIAGILKANLA